MNRVALTFFAAISMCGSVPALSACPIVNATYSGDDGATATFRQVARQGLWVSDLALGVRGATGHPIHWFLFDQGSARYINLISTTDVTRKGWMPPSADGGERPLGDTHFIAVARSLAVILRVPTSRDSAPEYLLLPDLPEVLAHRASPPEDMGLFFFKLAHCGGRRPQSSQ